jgi:hypothetical protein
MLKIKYDERVYEIKNSPNELLLKDFEHIICIFNDKDKQHFEKWSEILIYLGLPEDVVDNFDSFAFIDIIKEFNINDISDVEITKEFTIGEDLYVAYEDTFKLTVKEMSLIEYYISKNNDRYLGEIMAVIYKRPGFDKIINFDKAHIHHKAELFRKNIMADKAVPFISFLSKKLIKDYESIEESSTI